MVDKHQYKDDERLKNTQNEDNVCTHAVSAEHARFDLDDLPCDDGRSGGKQ